MSKNKGNEGKGERHSGITVTDPGEHETCSSKPKSCPLILSLFRRSIPTSIGHPNLPLPGDVGETEAPFIPGAARATFQLLLTSLLPEASPDPPPQSGPKNRYITPQFSSHAQPHTRAHIRTDYILHFHLTMTPYPSSSPSARCSPSTPVAPDRVWTRAGTQ